MGDQHKFKPQLVMYKPTLQDLPPIKLPDGYDLRSFQSGDEEDWEFIISRSFQYKSNFTRDIEGDGYFSPERVLFLCHGPTPVATATAWYRPSWGENTGYLHMVGVLPSHGGKGLGMQVSLAALHQMKREGKQASVLETDDFRIPAIKIYLRLGYRPFLVHENQGERWHDIMVNNHSGIDS